MMTETQDVTQTHEEKLSNIERILASFDGKIILEPTKDEKRFNFDDPITGKYVARIIALKRVTGDNDKGHYDFFSLKFQIEEDVEGDASRNQRIDKLYSIGVSKFNDDPNAGVTELFKDLFTSGIIDKVTFTSSGKYEIAEEIAEQLVDKLMNLNTYVTKKGNQKIKVVDVFVLSEETKKEEGDKEASSW